MKDERDADCKSDREERLHISHHSCKCNIGALWWKRGRKDRESYLSYQPFVHPIDSILHPISEEDPCEGSDQGNMLLVLDDAKSSGGMTGEDQLMVFLTKKEDERAVAVVEGYLDSGANSHIFNTKEVFEEIDTQNTNLITACSGEKGNTANRGKIKPLTYNTETTVSVSSESKGVYCSTAVHNLLSVGKLCETDRTIVFDQHGYVVFHGKVSAEGRLEYAQGRDLRTGLYPITLNFEKKGVGLDILRTDHFCNMDELRTACGHMSVWAERECEKRERRYTEEEQRVDIINKDVVRCNLARFYVKQGMSDMERWHSKLGHVGTKIIKGCNIDKLKIPKTPFRCEHCIRGKMHTGNHSTRTTGRKSELRAGEYIITDLQGPYVRDINGNKYSQIFIDVVSKKSVGSPIKEEKTLRRSHSFGPPRCEGPFSQ